MNSLQNYKLTSNDFRVWVNIINMQNIAGAGRPSLDDLGVNSFIRWIDEMTLTNLNAVDSNTMLPYLYSVVPNVPFYNSISNTQIISWIDNLFLNLENLETSYDERKFPELYLANMYCVFQNSDDCKYCLPPDWYIHLQAFVLGLQSLHYNLIKCNTSYIYAWARPDKPSSWRTAIDNTFDAWTQQGVPQAFACNNNYNNFFSTEKWTNVSGLKPAIAPLWDSQESALADLQSQESLDNNGCMFLFFLLCSLGTGNAEQQQSVQTITAFATNSFERANDTFIDTLLYYVLMLWIDPTGNYKFNSAQITNNLKSLDEVLINTDSGTQAIKVCVAKTLDILNAEPDFPAEDLYCPGVEFNTRRSDVLSAINEVWPCK